MNQKMNSLIGVIVLLAIVVFGNIVANQVNVRIDVTEDGLYTLSQGSKNIIKNLEDDITVRFYFSESIEGVNPDEKVYSSRVLSMLKEYQLYSNKISLEVIDPEPDSDAEEVADRHGLAPRMTPYQERSYFGLVISNFNGEEVIKRFDPSRERFLEYDITRAIYLLNISKGKPVIGLMSSLNILGDPPQHPRFGQPPQQRQQAWFFTHEMKRMYDVQKIETTVSKIPNNINLLVVMHPNALPEKAEYAIDQYLMSGKNVIFFVDPQYLRDQQQGNQFQPPPTNTSLNKVFKAWGVEMNYNKIVTDPLMAAFVQQGVKHPAVLEIGQQRFNKDDVSTSQLNQMLMVFPSVVSKKDGFDDIKFTSLIETSEDAEVKDKFSVLYTRDPRQLIQSIKSGGKKETLAGMFEGKFKSAFAKPPEGVTGEHLKEAKESVSFVVVGDVDMLENQFCIRPIQFGNTVLGYQPLNQNSIFFNNTLEKMLGNRDLISLRSRGKFRRPFDKVTELENEARKKFADKEKELQEKVSEVNKKIQDLMKKVDPSQNTIVSSTVQAEVAKFKKERIEISRELRAVRRNLNKDIEKLGYTIKTINIGLMPLLIIVFGLFMYANKVQKVGK